MERDIKPTYDELESYVENLQKQLADAQATIAALQARVKELEEITKVICGHCCEPMEIPSKAVLQSALTQRTAELEAANKLIYKKNCELGRAETINNDLQAELERVRGLIKALPKVEGEITCSQQFDSAWRLHYWQVEAYEVAGGCVYRLNNLREDDAKAYAALLKHRQGMEG